MATRLNQFLVVQMLAMPGKEMSIKDLERVCKDADYAIVIDGTTYAADGASVTLDADGQHAVMQVETSDESILSKLTGTMLGPSTEFSEIKVCTTGADKHTVYANLASYVQGPSRITLHLMVLRAECC